MKDIPILGKKLQELGARIVKELLELFGEVDEADGPFHAVAAARADDGESWWAATKTGDRYPCRILNFERKSDSLQAMFGDARFLGVRVTPSMVE